MPRGVRPFSLNGRGSALQALFGMSSSGTASTSFLKPCLRWARQAVAKALASRASMAVWLHQRDKYFDFHNAMLSNKGALSNAKVMELARQSGVNTDALAVQMQDGNIDKAFATTHAQAEALSLTGTPAFIIGEAVAPGAIPLSAMRHLVAAAREAAVN